MQHVRPPTCHFDFSLGQPLRWRQLGGPRAAGRRVPGVGHALDVCHLPQLLHQQGAVRWKTEPNLYLCCKTGSQVKNQSAYSIIAWPHRVLLFHPGCTQQPALPFARLPLAAWTCMDVAYRGVVQGPDTTLCYCGGAVPGSLPRRRHLPVQVWMRLTLLGPLWWAICKQGLYTTGAMRGAREGVQAAAAARASRKLQDAVYFACWW